MMHPALCCGRVASVSSLFENSNPMVGLTRSQQADDGQKLLPLWRVQLAFLVLPNLLMWLAGKAFHADRPLIDLDYLAAGVVALFFPRFVGIAAFALAVVFDLLGTFAGVYHFDASNVVESLGQLFQVNPAFLGPVIIVGLTGAGALAWLATRFAVPTSTRARRFAAAASVVIACALFGVDALNGTTAWTPTGRALMSVNLVTSQGHIATVALLDSWERRNHRPVEGSFREIPAATDRLRRRLVIGPTPTAVGSLLDEDVLLVIVESLGQAVDDSLNHLVLSPLLGQNVRERYEVRKGTVPFSGATSSGEFRELCGEDRDYRLAPRDTLSRCLPAMFRARGYRTMSFHGYRGRFYDRNTWYPLVGFDKSLFAPELARAGATKACGTIFVGACDAAVARVIVDSLKAPRAIGERHFTYWLTLSSHFPIDVSGSENSSLSCNSIPEASRSTDVCHLMRLWRVAIENVAAIATNPELRPTRIVIVGDHSPPFALQQHRALYSQTVVPFIELVPVDHSPHRFASHPAPGGASE